MLTTTFCRLDVGLAPVANAGATVHPNQGFSTRCGFPSLASGLGTAESAFPNPRDDVLYAPLHPLCQLAVGRHQRPLCLELGGNRILIFERRQRNLDAFQIALWLDGRSYGKLLIAALIPF